MNKDGHPQKWEVSSSGVLNNGAIVNIPKGIDSELVYRSKFTPTVRGKFRKTSDESLKDFKYHEKKAGKQPVVVKIPEVSSGEHILKVNTTTYKLIGK